MTLTSAPKYGICKEAVMRNSDFMFCSDFAKIFPAYCCQPYSGSVDISEKDSQAKVRKLTLANGTCFQYIDTAIVKDMTSFFQKANTDEIFHHDCDGMVIFDGNDGKKYLYIAELKSTFDSSDIYYAFKQIISSLVKIQMLLSLLPCYNPSDFVCKAFIVSLPPNAQYLRDLQRKSISNKSNRYLTETEIVLLLCYGNDKDKKLIVKPQDCHFFKDLPITGFKEIELRHISVPAGNDSITLDVNSYISTKKPFRCNRF